MQRRIVAIVHGAYVEIMGEIENNDKVKPKVAGFKGVIDETFVRGANA